MLCIDNIVGMSKSGTLEKGSKIENTDDYFLDPATASADINRC